MAQFVRTDKSIHSDLFEDMNKVHIPATPKRIRKGEEMYTVRTAVSIEEQDRRARFGRTRRWNRRNLLKISSSIQKRFFRVTNHFFPTMLPSQKAYENCSKLERSVKYKTPIEERRDTHLRCHRTGKEKSRRWKQVLDIIFEIRGRYDAKSSGYIVEVQKLYSVLRERQKWFEDVKDLGESNRKWPSKFKLRLGNITTIGLRRIGKSMMSFSLRM